MRSALIFSLVFSIAGASVASESRANRAWRQMEDAAHVFHSQYHRFPRNIAELHRFAVLRHLPLPLNEFVRIHIRYIDPQQSALEGETKPPGSNSEGRRLIVTY